MVEDREAQDVMRDGGGGTEAKAKSRRQLCLEIECQKEKNPFSELNGNSSAAAEEIGLSIADTEL